MLVVTAKNMTAQDRAKLGAGPGHAIHIIEKPQFNSTGFLAEVRRALRTKEEHRGTHTDH